ncbi:hypothetical protein EI42_05832 [Thermosporothrix hazakensis]|jgi:hypothetical protein|uniref:Uncharacterized protein n=1 Tax=Thermosporothrix hazakensis TaxID=644383 RepID=A0A326U521_THEHA|nr:hypothetical protein [Thermosporothrix hazakensis]PZW20757.1 hypothetical protein EI42_05832 [Thermosporothrix hazakensis]GCE50474.1 hypothetical protein KTH_53430 [Thermosporothrix hazakensis]
MADYADYYGQTIDNYQRGFQFVLGGTGIGKTSAIRKVVTIPKYQDRKFIYCANRTQLLEEMAQELDSSSYIYLRRDLDVVVQTLEKHQDELYEFLNDPMITQAARNIAQENSIIRFDIADIQRHCQDLKELIKEKLHIHRFIESHAEYLARQILGSFKFILLTYYHKGNIKIYEKLLDHPVIQYLFPYIAFKRRKEVRILLVTLQKAYYGFFDGKRTLNLTRLQHLDGGYIIFLDEFDFLEHDLVSLICRSAQIGNPFHFIERFYSAMEKHKIPLETYPFSQNVRNRILDILALLKKLQKEGLAFPEIYQFTSTMQKKVSTIFRTRHIISTDLLFLKQTKRSFEILSKADAQALNDTQIRPAPRLFDTVSSVCALILTLLKELERENEIIYQEILRQCFQETVFLDQVKQITHYVRVDKLQQTQLQALLETGYSLYNIKDLQQQTDHEEVEVRYYSMYLTPERILSSLIRDNLVFGLSATADISRLVHHFHIDWLERQQALIPINENQKNIIRSLHLEKKRKRNNKIKNVILEGLDLNDPYQHALDQFLSAVAKHDDFGDDTSSGHLKRRTQLFFATLLWLCEYSLPTPEHDTTLLFFNTFRQIKLIFDRYPRPEGNLFLIEKHEGNSCFDTYEIEFKRKSFLVVFYNAEMGNKVRQEQGLQNSFDKLFWQNKPVIVVTQYLSAGNGVNLQYSISEGKTEKQDFTRIGLLEKPYFYFRKLDENMTPEERVAAIKENIWYQAKLFSGKAISEHRFIQVLSSLNEPNDWSNRYQNDPSTADDALINNIATFIQALGRIERVWSKMPDQTVFFSEDVYACFQAFCSERFDDRHNERESMFSDNLQQIFAQVREDLSRRERESWRQRDARLVTANQRCQDAVHRLLARLEGLRRGNCDNEARHLWEQLRQATLKHHFSDTLLKKYFCVMESPFYSKGVLHINPQREIIPARLKQADTTCWNMNDLYRVIKENTVICNYFLSHGYELVFDHSTQHFFTPYCYQAILTGAVGEEAITAILRDKHIQLESVPDALFEIADSKIKGVPWYIDCKNYNEFTLERFSLSENDPAWHPKLNERHFKENALRKLQRISLFHGQAGKIIYLNLISARDLPFGFYDHQFRQVHRFSDAAIVVIQGAIQRNQPNEYQPAFTRFLSEIKQMEA